MASIKELIQKGNIQDKSKLPNMYLFLNMYNKGIFKIVYENEKYFSIVPSNKDGPQPLDNTAKSPMSLIHALVCPKARIWNAVDIEEMKQFDKVMALECANESVRRLRESEFHPGCLYDRLKEVNEKKMWSDVAEKTNDLEKAKELSMTIEYSFHLYPYNSVNHLHMHVWCPKLATKSYDLQMQKNPNKNAPMDKVLQTL